MFFPLRAAVVIGAIVYLSPVREPLLPEAASQRMSDGLAALPERLRDQAIQAGAEALAKGALPGRVASQAASQVVAQAANQAAILRAGLDRDGITEPQAASRDTLRDGDRSAPWRGTEKARR